MHTELPPMKAAELRREAEERLRSRRAAEGGPKTDADRERLLHELEVHQIELEMQNEELQHAHQVAERGLRHYFELFDLAPIGYFRLNAEGVISEANLAGAELVGDVRARLIGRRFPLFVHEKSRPALAAFLAQVFATGSRRTCEIELARESSPPAFVELTATLAPGQEECLVGMVDITARRQAETMRESMEGQLRQSQKLDAVGQLAGGIAHDFNNLLTVIIGNASAPRFDEYSPDDQRERLEEICVAGERAASLTRQLLLFSRQKAPDLHHLDLNEIVAPMAGVLRRILGEQIELEFRAAPQPQVVRADAGMLDQIVLNLAVNARDAMPAGGRLIIQTEGVSLDADGARTRPDASPGDFSCLSVIDTGCGMSREVQERMFEPFYTTKAAGLGTGLGLSTIHGIVHQHHGWIEVTSKPGQGTSMRIFLPRVSETPAAGKKAPEPRDIAGRGETILLVEDERVVRRLIASALIRTGYRVIESESGAAAFECWPEHRQEVDLLLTDVVMPGGVDGPALALKLLEDQPRLKVMLMSGYDASLGKDRARLGSDVDFIPKPFVLTELLRKVRQRLDAGVPR